MLGKPQVVDGLGNGRLFLIFLFFERSDWSRAEGVVVVGVSGFWVVPCFMTCRENVVERRLSERGFVWLAIVHAKSVVELIEWHGVDEAVDVRLEMDCAGGELSFWWCRSASSEGDHHNVGVLVVRRYDSRRVACGGIVGGFWGSSGHVRRGNDCCR